jgi:hypothetical protein
LLLIAGCQGASSDPGTRARLRVSGAQFVPGAMPKDGSGPKVLSVLLNSFRLAPGLENKSLQGSVGGNASAIAIGFSGDSGYWIILPGDPDPFSAGVLTFKATLSFSPDLAAGTYELDVRAVDSGNHFGPAQKQMLMTEANPIASAPLAFSLYWSNDTDLDIHVVDPAGDEVWARDKDSYSSPSPGLPADPGTIAAGGFLDYDSNALCVIDGRDQEDVLWPMTAPTGHYLVRVDAFSLCGQTVAYWRVEARRSGVVVATAEGVATQSDADLPHQRGSGVLALEIDQP